MVGEMKRTVALLAAPLMVSLLPLVPAAAQEYATTDSIVQVELLEGWREPDGSHYAGIQINLAPGWRTYWRAPGDGGIPTRVSWEGSNNLKDAQIHWPRPGVFRSSGMRSVGYDGSVVLPVHVAPETAGDIDAQLTLTLGVCKDVCIPVRVTLDQTLPSEGAANIAMINGALEALPEKADASLSCAIQTTEEGYKLAVSAMLPELDGRGETSVVELPGQDVWISEPVFDRNEDWIISTVRMINFSESDQIDLDALRMTVLTTTSAVELTGCN
jgi:DsbC/DsbD-like thiol-disulfide interchange protein